MTHWQTIDLDGCDDETALGLLGYAQADFLYMAENIWMNAQESRRSIGYRSIGDMTESPEIRPLGKIRFIKHRMEQWQRSFHDILRQGQNAVQITEVSWSSEDAKLILNEFARDLIDGRKFDSFQSLIAMCQGSPGPEIIWVHRGLNTVLIRAGGGDSDKYFLTLRAQYAPREAERVGLCLCCLGQTYMKLECGHLR